jgi:hypothetical protein
LQIVKTDNALLNALDHAIVRRGMAKADYSVDELSYKQTVDRLTLAADTLNKQLISERELNASITGKAKTQQLITYLLLGVILFLLITMMTRRRRYKTG